MFENWVLRKISGSKRDEVTGEKGILYNKGLYDRCFSPDMLVIR